MDQAAIISSAEEQLKNFGSFLDIHDKKLQQLSQKTTKVPSARPPPTLKILTTPLVEVNYSANQEQLSLLRLLESDRLLNKTLLTFAHLCAEVDTLTRRAEHMQIKFLYIDENLCALLADEDGNGGPDAARQTNEILLQMSESMQFVCDIQFLLQRCIVLDNNLLHQCGAYCALEDNKNLEFRFVDVFDCLADLLLQILIFNEILAGSNFCRFWPTYKKTVEALAQNGQHQEFCTASELIGLRNCLEEFDFLFSGTIFQSFLDSTFALKDKIGPKGIGQLTNQCNEYMKQCLLAINKCEVNEFSDHKLLVRLNAFCVVFHDFCGQVETKHVKHLLELNQKYQGIILIGNVAWQPTPFLRRHATSLVKPHERLLGDGKRLQQHYLQTRVQTLPRDCRNYCSQVLLLTLNIRKALSIGPFDLTVQQFKELSALLLLGLRFASQISCLIKGLVNAHVILQSPMTKITLQSICKLIELLKNIQQLFQEYMDVIAKVMQCVLQYLQYKVLHLLNLCKKRITAAKMHDRNVDALASLRIAEKCMTGPPTKTRTLLTKLAVNATNLNNRTLPQDQCERFQLLMSRITILADFHSNMNELCDTTFIYWHQSVLSAYLKQVVERKLDFNSFQYILHAFNDCDKAFEVLDLKELKLSKCLERVTYDNLRSEIVSKLCAQIETFLRLEVHSNLQLEKMSPFEHGIDDYRDLINACPIKLNGNYVILKDHVENYLSAMFYNLTTISLQDWKTYEEMRHLANTRLMLKPVEDYLPNQTLEQGIDILEIMRKIHIFVSKYVYNMNTQIFVEQRSANKHLDSIGIRHVANSLRTHGTGVINTTVNFTYQFLRQKFYTFSQFLYDEQIKSRLMKELRAYAERKQTKSYPVYAYERADAFNKDIRKLGLSNDGQTYMDLFRKVITHVGNAMGYIRLVRSGSIHANYSASLYLPKFDENLQFATACSEQELDPVTVKAAENFEVNISNLVKSFSDSTDYFKLLVEAFQPFFRNPHNLHLKNFFLIVPALSLNYVEYMLRVKEKINKKDRQEALLFDDGFAVGLAYILKLLNQIDDFYALHWFATVRERFNAERLKIQQMLLDIKKSTNTRAGAKGNSKAALAMQNSETEKLQQTLALTERRINAHQMEYNLLYCNLCSAKIFFQ
ncbi:PREDICTED: WASH complex subunit 7 homolog [Bactrocera latifrons]|uniref:WASH complex subunit 7 homolog n=1 Tax=Bactrocera latifrons TaxID=174628 RepID=UPI0008DC8554|nr:PREDICTED: WASH complex subunit 7 homolog [Bactrocera latifrons]